MGCDNAHISGMKQILAPLALCLTLGAPAFTQEMPNDGAQGLGLIERGFRQLFDGFLQEMEPALDDMAEAMKDLQPMARQLADLIGDIRYYDAPERLENGDIIIRRKAGAPPPPALPETKPPADIAPDGQIEL